MPEMREMAGSVSVAERLRLRLADLTPAERKVAHALMADYPVAGLEPVARLATAAGVSSAGADRATSMLDLGRRDVLVAFDYRRYQRDKVRLAVTAKKQGATLIAFTDPYLSPLSSYADVILTSSVASPSPFDPLTLAVALAEAVIAALVDRLGDAPRARMARYDALYAGAVDGPRAGSHGWLEGP
jgi:DNA-binding MurR/RpiR family transcriptional regulator